MFHFSNHFPMMQVVLLVLVAGYVSGANILILQDIPSPSHSIWTAELARGLVKRGHNVTRVAPGNFREHNRGKDYHAIYFEGVGGGEAVITDLIQASTYKTMLLFYEYDIEACKAIYQSKGLEKLLEYPSDSFDAVVIDITLGGCLLPLIKKFNYPPTIGVTPFLFPYYLALDFGSTIGHSYIPGFLVPFSDNMNFFERLTNYFWINLDLLFRKCYLKAEVQKLAAGRFGDSVGDLEDIRKHVSLLLSNVDMTLHYPQELAPNVIPVGGLHVHRAGQLPQDLQSLLDNAKKGVILFSLGTNVRSDRLNPEIRDAIIKALSRLEQIVIWKFETNLTEVPSNVIIRQWVPQTEILAHRNTRLFISHGGGLSTMEAAYYGVPVLGIPFFVDQFINLIMMENKGIARQISYPTISEDIVYTNIREMLDNPKYAENMKKASNRMKDQPQTPLDRAVYWIEYSIRHNGTHFLNLKSRDLPLFVASGLDIHLFLLLVGCFIILVVTKVFRYCISCATGTSKIKTQ